MLLIYLQQRFSRATMATAHRTPLVAARASIHFSVLVERNCVSANRGERLFETVGVALLGSQIAPSTDELVSPVSNMMFRWGSGPSRRCVCLLSVTCDD